MNIGHSKKKFTFQTFIFRCEVLVSRSVHPSTSINCAPLDFINFFHWANGLSRISGAELPKAINVKFATSYYPNVGKKASDDGKNI